MFQLSELEQIAKENFSRAEQEIVEVGENIYSR